MSTGLRPHGRHYPSPEAAARSKRAREKTAEPARCGLPGCSGWRLEKLKAAAAPKRSANRRARPFPPIVAAALELRDQHCQRCGSGRDLEHHHRRLKASTGSRREHTQCSCNGILLCRKCHGWAHRGDRPAAEAQGFIVSQSVDEPGSIGVMRLAAAQGGALQWPTCDGQWASTAAEAGEAA